MNKKYLLLTALLCYGLMGISQTDTLFSGQLKEVTVMGERVIEFQTGTGIEKTDSLLSGYYKTQSISHLLEISGSALVRQYNPGMLSSTSIRGGTAQQTGIVWQGINLNSQANGMLDVNLIPSFLFDQVQLVPGISGSLQGSGPIGGGILLNNGTQPVKGVQLRLLHGSGSFHQTGTGLEIKAGKGTLFGKTALFYQRAVNDFTFYNQAYPGNPEQTLSHSAIRQFHLMQELSKTYPRGKVSVYGWIVRANRQIPPTKLMLQSDAVQSDASERALLSWKHRLKTGAFGIKIMASNEAQTYADAPNLINSKMKLQTLSGDADYRFSPKKWWTAAAGTTYQFSRCRADAYQNIAQRGQLALWYLQTIHLSRWKTKVDLRLRKEWTQSIEIPLIPGIGWRIEPFRFLTVSGQVNRVFRIPALNDLYWNPGGNPDLKPEQGKSGEMSVEIRPASGRREFSTQVTAYQREINDWIQWQPYSMQIWTPVNTGKVLNRGLELRIHFRQPLFKKTGLRTGLNYDLCRSENRTEGDAYFSKQLIYTPLHKANAYALLEFAKTNLMVSYVWVDRRFTTPDHLESLPAYGLLNAGITRHFNRKWLVCEVFFKANNLLNHSYETIIWRPMPGRGFEAGVEIRPEFKVNKKINKYFTFLF